MRPQNNETYKIELLMTLTYSEIAQIIKLIDSSSCDEMILDIDDLKLTMRRQSAGIKADYPVISDSKPSNSETPQDLPTERITNNQAKELASMSELIEVRSPMIGTFYRAASPSAPPFVEEGSVVNKGDPLCLIEVMKLYTTVSATVSGTVLQICSENGEMVGADAVLFRIKPT